MEEDSSDSNDSLELPDLFQEKSSESKDLKHIRPGDIVWAEFRQLHWPALVRSVYVKDKKMSVWYLDSPGFCFKVPWMKIKQFDDKNINEMVRKQASQSPFKEMHDKVLLQTLSYIRRKACGLNDNPRKFFDSNVPYLSIKNLESSSSQNQTVSFKEFSSPGMKSFKDSDDEISDNDCNEDSLLDSFSNMLEDSDPDSYDKETENKIVMYIKGGRTDKHLLAVQCGKISSVYHNIYEESIVNNRKKLWSINPCKLVRNLDKLREICCYLMDLFEKSVEGGKCVMHRYITAVWLPEAIDKAVSFIEDELKSPNKISRAKRNLMTCKKNSFKKKSQKFKKGCKSKRISKIIENI